MKILQSKLVELNPKRTRKMFQIVNGSNRKNIIIQIDESPLDSVSNEGSRTDELKRLDYSILTEEEFLKAISDLTK